MTLGVENGLVIWARPCQGGMLWTSAADARAVDPWWDLYALTAYGDEWRQFIPVQVAGRAPVDTAGMTSRVEDLLEATLSRL